MQNLTRFKFSAPDEIPNLLLYHKFAAFSNFERSRHEFVAAMIAADVAAFAAAIKFDSWFAAAMDI